ncbi:MAG: hypothetical protein EOT05_02110 [Candidatus Microsaccharimonas sossegonensis]|uniref:Uncharacterized protein n=1 Tax=Candidatus Microsaccharimonas sossegonensis TaxID=2506948 RepID=A0A4Q0AH78_9BACT|nr:MAG: hypothetical protein EOT05_02110 [Candidatus Microsaccharimonas sossegonensis]
MTTIKMTFDQKIDNVQGQLNMMNSGDSVFKGYVHRQFEVIAKEMVTKEDLRNMEARIGKKMATKKDLNKLEARIESKMATKADLNKLTEIVIKIADKVGVSA